MTPARRTAEIQAEHLEGLRPVDHIAERRAGIMECEWAEDRFALALTLAMHRPLSIATARLALSAAPERQEVEAAQAWASRLVEPDQDSLGVTRGH